MSILKIPKSIFQLLYEVPEGSVLGSLVCHSSQYCHHQTTTSMLMVLHISYHSQLCISFITSLTFSP